MKNFWVFILPTITVFFIVSYPVKGLEYPPGFRLIEVPDPLNPDNPGYPLVAMDMPDPGESFFDLRFQTILTRVTLTDGIRGRHEYSRFDPFNRTGSMVILDPDTLWSVYRTIPIPYNQTSNLVRNVQMEELRWDCTNENLILGLSAFSIVSADVTTGEIFTVKDFSQDGVIGPVIAAQPVYRITTRDEGEPSRDFRFWALLLQGDERVNYEPLFIFCWDRHEDQITGYYFIPPGDRDIDWVGMSWMGNWVLIGGMDGNTGNLAGLTMSDRSFSAFHRLDFSTAHSDVGLDAEGREVVVMQNARTDYIDLIPISLETQPILENGGSYEGTNRTPLIRLFYDSESPIGLQSGVHISCNYPGYALVSTTIEPGLAEQNWLDRCIVLTTLDAHDSHTCYLAKLYNTTQAYWEETHASISNDGSRVVWASNWGQNIGDERVFLMHLRMPPLTPNGLHLTFEMPGTSFHQGDPFHIDLDYSNSDQDTNLDLYVLLDVAGEFFFFPDWQSIHEGLDYVNTDFHTGDGSIEIVPEFVTPAVSDTGTLYLYAAAFQSGTLDAATLKSDVAVAGFGFFSP